MSVRDMLLNGDFNHMAQEKQPDGSIIVKLSKRGERRQYIMKVRDLYGPDELVESETVEEV